MKFRLEIELGNDALRGGDDIAHALRRVANVVNSYDERTLAGADGRIRDINGNTVGSWSVEDAEPIQCEKCGRALDSEHECPGGCSQPRS